MEYLHVTKEDFLSDFSECIKSMEVKISERKIDVLCFVNQDSYRLYQLVKESRQQEESTEGFKTVYINDWLKNSTPEEFLGKKVLLFDVLMGEGYQLFKCYCALTELGVSVAYSYTYACYPEWIGNDLYHMMEPIYRRYFGVAETNEHLRTATEAIRSISKSTIYDAFLQHCWIGTLYPYTYLVRANYSLTARELIKMLHQEAYAKFNEGRWNFESSSVNERIPETIRWMVMRSTPESKVSIKDIKDTIMREFGLQEEELKSTIVQVLDTMQELEIVEFSEISQLRLGKNANWLVCKEGRLCYLCACTVFFQAHCEFSMFLSMWKEISPKAKEYCAKISKEYNEPFDEKIFDYYIDWYLSMNNDYSLLAQRFMREEMTPLESKVWEEVEKIICE